MPNVPTPADAPSDPDGATVIRTFRLCLEAVELQFEALRLRAEFFELNRTWVAPAYAADDDEDPQAAFDFEDRWGFALAGSILHATAELLDQPWNRDDTRSDTWGQDHVGYIAELADADTPFGQALRSAADRSSSGARPAMRGERCSCGTTAVVVHETSRFGDRPSCGHDHPDAA